MKLDAKTVAALRLDGKTDAIFFDSEMPGFGYRLRLGAAGKINRSWIVQYRRAGSSRRLLLGSADVLSAAQAREAARKALAKAQLGEDPQQERQDRRAKDKVRFSAVVAEYLDIAGRKLRPKTLYETRTYLQRGSHFRPLHDMPLDKVTRRDVASQLVRIERERGSAAAHAARAKLSGFYAWAVKFGLVEANPVVATPIPEPSKPRDKVLTDDELAAIWNALPPDSEYGRMIRLLTLLGARRQEVGGCAWSELDLDAGVWTKPSTRTKNKREHRLPLPRAALDIIKSVPKMASRDQLFGLRAAVGFSNFTKVKLALDAASGVRGARLHDIRRTVSTRLHDLATPPHVVEQVLGHRTHRAGSAGTYNWSEYRDEVAAALDKWQRYVLMIADGGLRAAHKRFTESGDEKQRKASRKVFLDSIAEGDARWNRYLGMLKGDAAANVVNIPRKGS
jgi:integrase